jgi:hypothetical protein
MKGGFYLVINFASQSLPVMQGKEELGGEKSENGKTT